MLEVKIKHLHYLSRKPVRATDGAAGLDVFAISEHVISPGVSARIPLGFALEIPRGWCARLKQRSGLFYRLGIILNDSPIDSDYRGEVIALACNTGRQPWLVNPGDRVGQLLFERVPEVEFRTVDELSDTARSEGGFGSTGV